MSGQTQGEMGVNLRPGSPKPEESSSLRVQRLRDNREGSLDRRESIEVSDSFKAREKYKDVADAAQAAFESAAYAAAAARAAVELSRSDTPRGPNDPSSPSPKNVDPDFAETNYDPEKLEFGNRGHAHSFSSSSSGSHGEVHINVTDEVDELPSEPVTETISHLPSWKQIPSSFHAELNVETENTPLPLNLETRPISVRTRRLRGY